MASTAKSGSELHRYKERWRELHGDVELTPVVSGWLEISFRIARLLNALRLTPNSLSILGGAFSLGLYLFAKSWTALVFLALALIADGVDGSLAIYQSRESTRGALIDSIIDRISEFFWLLALLRIGGELAWALAIYVFALTQEYVRARLLGVGDFETGVVTVAERPHRAIYCALALITFHLENLRSWLPHHLTRDVLIVWAAIQLFSLMMVLRNAYSQITSKNRLSY